MLSVVIPTHDCERSIVPTLAALVPGALAGLVREVILADAGSQDRTLDIAEAAGCVVLTSAEPLGTRLATAAGQARAPWLLFLRPGFAPDASWTGAVADFMQRGDDRVAVFRRAPAADERRSIGPAILALLRARLTHGPTPDQGLLISKRLYGELGGHGAVSDPETDLLARIGWRRILLLDCGSART
jgi:glycosyltransferase involved in cell wall biosynthesis